MGEKQLEVTSLALVASRPKVSNFPLYVVIYLISDWLVLSLGLFSLFADGLETLG